MGGVAPGSPVSATNTNSAFIDANGDDTGIGVYTLANTLTATGAQVDNIQREHNSAASFMGKSLNSIKNDLPAWTNNQVGTSGDNLKQRADSLTAKFDATTGHAHDGTSGNGAPIQSGSIAAVQLKGVVIAGTDLTSVTGSDIDISAYLTGETPSNSSSIKGVVVNNPYNQVPLRDVNGDFLKRTMGPYNGATIYGRITESSGVWTLSFYYMAGTTETVQTLTAEYVKWFYQKLINPIADAGFNYSDQLYVPSQNATADVITATTTDQGKVSLQNADSTPVGTQSQGTANAVVANADHAHEGVHSIGIDGDPTQALGDAKLKAGDNVTLVWDTGKIKISSNGGVGYQEILPGTVNGINASFGPTTFVPSDNNSILVMIDYVVVPSSGYIVSGSNITFLSGWIPVTGQTVYAFYLTAGTPSIPVISGVFKVEYRTLTSGEATAKSLTLALTPAAPNEVMLDLIGGTAQEPGVDFIVSGNSLNWTSYGLDGLLATGDKLRIAYIT